MMFNKSSTLFLLLIGAQFYLPVFAQEVPTPQQALQNFGIDAAQIAQLERGEIVDYEVSETSHKELAIGVAMILPATLPQIVNYIKLGNLTATESDIIATGSLTNNADINSFKKFAFTDKQIDEAKSFLNAEPGDKFNLSELEIDSLKSLQASLEDADNKTLLKAANQKYREILLQRLQAYRKSGLSGITAYSRENGNADPAEELRNDVINSKTWTRYFPELQEAWLNYPAALPPNATEQFLWSNRSVEDRPTAILIHRVMVNSEAGGIIVSRQFYVGHSYNSSHVVAIGLPYKEGTTLVFYSTRSSTDQVAGMGSSLKHSIGREQMKKEMIKRLQRVNKDLKNKATCCR
jgi:hypothetical protein